MILEGTRGKMNGRGASDGGRQACECSSAGSEGPLHEGLLKRRVELQGTPTACEAGASCCCCCCCFWGERPKHQQFRISDCRSRFRSHTGHAHFLKVTRIQSTHQRRLKPDRPSAPTSTRLAQHSCVVRTASNSPARIRQGTREPSVSIDISTATSWLPLRQLLPCLPDRAQPCPPTCLQFTTHSSDTVGM